MKSLLRRNLLLVMLGVTAVTLTGAVTSPAFAKSGGSDSDDSASGSKSDSGGGSHSQSGGGDDSSGSDHHSSGSSGSDDDSSSGDDGSQSSSDKDDSSDDSQNRSAKADAGNSRAARPRIQLSVDAATLAGLTSGSLAAVDNLGRVLEVEVENVKGAQVVIAKPHGGDAKRNPGPITSYEIVPASQAPAHQ